MVEIPHLDAVVQFPLVQLIMLCLLQNESLLFLFLLTRQLPQKPLSNWPEPGGSPKSLPHGLFKSGSVNQTKLKGTGKGPHNSRPKAESCMLHGNVSKDFLIKQNA